MVSPKNLKKESYNSCAAVYRVIYQTHLPLTFALYAKTKRRHYHHRR